MDNDTIDFVECFEKYLTFDRVLHECNMVAATTNPATTRLMTFAVLDKFQEVCRFAGVPAGRGFHHLYTRPFLEAVLRPAFARLPAPWDAHFQTAADRLYDELYAAVRSPRGVWPNFLVEPGGVRVYREWDRAVRQFVTPAPATLTDDEFVAEYVRSARNTHHGYVSDGVSPASAPSRPASCPTRSHSYRCSFCSRNCSPRNDFQAITGSTRRR